MRTDIQENKLTPIQTDIERQTQVGIQRQTQAGRQAGRQPFRERHRPEDSLDRQPAIQRPTQAGRQTGRHSETDTETHIRMQFEPVSKTYYLSVLACKYPQASNSKKQTVLIETCI